MPFDRLRTGFDKLSMSGKTLAVQGIPLTLNSSKGERNAFSNGLLAAVR